MAPRSGKWKFSAVPGVFKNYTSEDMPDGKLPTQPRLGLLHRAYPRTGDETTTVKHEPLSDDASRDWPRFAAYVRELNAEAASGVKYKVLYLTRHGVGYHNQKQAAIGNDLWDVSSFFLLSSIYVLL